MLSLPVTPYLGHYKTGVRIPKDMEMGLWYCWDMQKTITKDELVSLILSSGRTFEDFAKQSKASVDADGLHVRVPVQTGLSVGWVGNPNFQGGKRNGYGCGLYAFVQAGRLSTVSVLLKAA